MIKKLKSLSLSALLNTLQSVILKLLMLPLMYMKMLKRVFLLEQRSKSLSNKKKTQNKQGKESHEKNISLLKQKINEELYIDIDYDEITQVIYLMLNRTSFAITLEEYAEFTINLNAVFEELVKHPNILLALEKDEDTQEEKRTFIYVDGQEDGFVN
jgi:hypothetical protein